MTRIDPGYAVYGGIFERAEMADALDRLAITQLDRTKAGARHVLTVPIVQELARDARMLRIASRFVGPNATPFRATVFDKSASANWLVVWHQDTALPLRCRVDDPQWGPWSTKGGVLYAHAPACVLERVVALRLSLDDSTYTNGPLRVLPDTHNDGVLNEKRIQQLAAQRTPVTCVTSSGGVVAMRPLTLHASSKSIDGASRRVLHIEYASSLVLDAGLELAVC